MSKKNKKPPEKILGFFPSREERDDVLEECGEFFGSFENLFEDDEDDDNDGDWD